MEPFQGKTHISAESAKKDLNKVITKLNEYFTITLDAIQESEFTESSKRIPYLKIDAQHGRLLVAEGRSIIQQYYDLLE